MFIIRYACLSLPSHANGEPQPFVWWVPPGFPQKPASYNDWGDYSFYHFSKGGWHWDWYKHFDPYLVDKPIPRLKDTTLIPFKIRLKGFKRLIPYGDSSFGKVYYDVDTSLLWSEKNRWLTIYWSIHKNIILDTLTITQNLWPVGLIDLADPIGSIAIDTHFDVVNIGGIKGYRHRGRWRESSCDQYFQCTGSFTTYYIPTEKFDFHILCRTLIYLHDPQFGRSELPPEVRDTLPLIVIKTYRDNIRKLERLVERTFRVRQ